MIGSTPRAALFAALCLLPSTAALGNNPEHAPPERNAARIAELLRGKGLSPSMMAAFAGDTKGAGEVPLTPLPTAAKAPPGVRLASRTEPVPASFKAAPGLAVCKEAVIEDNPLWTLITLKFTGDPKLESRPWHASRRLMLTVRDAQLPAYNQEFQSSGKLVSEVGLEQLPNEVRLMMKVAAGTDVTVYKRRTLAANTTEYAVLFEVPVDPVQGGGKGPMGWPVRGRLSSKYGWRLHPILHEQRMHSGIDIAVPEGTPIHAAGSGRVVYSANKGGAGLCVIIEHGGGRRSSYAHCSKLKVKQGETVKKNQVLALAGSTGLSTGPHVHFSITENGKHLDPMRVLGSMPGAKVVKGKSSKQPGKKSRKKAAAPPVEESHHDHDHD